MSTPTSTGGQPMSYKTNVNRAKTKRWVEAKSYSYDGDDWGDVDDYDEYGGYDEPAPPNKPTGLRQMGQTAQDYGEMQGQNLYQSPVSQDQTRGNFNQSNTQQPQGARSVTGPPMGSIPNLQNSSSFDRGDERRSFSTGRPQQGGSNVPGRGSLVASGDRSVEASDFYQRPTYTSHPSGPAPGQYYQNQPAGGTSMEPHLRSGEHLPQARGNIGLRPDQSRNASYDSGAPSMTSQDSSLDFHDRRDFSPSAMPPPLQTRNSPSPHNDPRSRLPRKSSLGLQNQPALPFDPQAPPSGVLDSRTDTTQRPRTGSSSSGKALPFVRPADIYKRIEEERIRERQSQDSSRPSIDAINRAADRPIPDARRDSESYQRVKPTPNPVTERKNDLGPENFNDSGQGTPGAMGQKLRTTSKTFEIKKPLQTSSSQPSSLSSGLMLPDPTRLSGFGEGFGESFMDSNSAFGGLARGSVPTTLVGEPPVNPQLSSRTNEDQGLQHQPSKGFTSAVHQAFDTAQDQVPPTPSSTADSSIGRSASGGTSAVSPIMSRGPSAVDRDRGGELPSIDDVTTPTQGQEAVDTGKLPRSNRNSHLFAQHAKDTEPPEDYVEEPPPGFKMGHRRDSGTPSPDNSPARTPALASMSHLRHPEAVDLAETTPTPTDSVPSASNSVRESEYSTKDDVESISKTSNVLTKHDTARRSYVDSPSSPAHSFLRQRTDSAGSGRVKDLAGKFEGNSRPESRTSNTTPRASILGPGAYITNEAVTSRPQNDRMESFRPHLPGGWESSTSIAPASAVTQEPSWTAPRPLVQPPATSNRTSRNPSPGSKEQRSVDNAGESPRHPFSAAAEADSALAGAPIAAYGTRESSNTKGVSGDPPMGGKERIAADTRSLGSHHVEPTVPSDTSPTTEGDATNPAHSGSLNYRPGQDVSSAAASLPRQPDSLPALSTNVQPRQYESDRLRREIVKELSPGVASEPTTAESDSPHQGSSRYTTNESLNPSDVTPGALPSDYDSYWNEDSDEASSRSSHRRGQPLQTRDLENTRSAPAIDQPSVGVANQQAKPAVPQPGSQQKQKKPHVLAHRFSWEQPLADLDSPTEPVQAESNAEERQPEVGPTSSFLESQMYPEKRAPATQADSRILTGPPELQNDVKQLPISSLPPSVARPSPSLDSRSPYDRGMETEREFSSDPAAPDTGIMEADEPVATDPPQTVGQIPAALWHQDQNAQPNREPSVDPDVPTTPLSSHEPPQTTAGPQNHLPPAAPITQAKFPAFREITALKSPAERIRAFNDTREQFANMNTGLQHWLALTSRSLSEHEDVIKNGGMTGAFRAGHKASQSKSKLGGLMTAQNSQPYYQQYLDATPQSGNLANTPGGAPPGQSPPQGFPTSAGSSGKMSSQQVQAKSKELLQSAGKYGGKANVAAKGLFSKGKSKLRDASGGKKAPHSASQPTAIESMQPQRADSQGQTTSRLEYEASQPKSDPDTKSSQASPHIDTADPARDAPSIYSVTQSQLGDDERSETSTAGKSDRLPRFSRLYRKGNPSGAKKEDASKLATVPGSGGFVPAQPTNGTAVDRPEEGAMQSQSPRSTGSSNKTPTQNIFDTSTLPHVLPGTGRRDPLQDQAVDPESDDNRQPGPAHVVNMSNGVSGPQTLAQPSPPVNADEAATPRLRPNSPDRANYAQAPSSEDSRDTASAQGEHGQPVYARSDERQTPGSDSQPETLVNHEEAGEPRSTLLSHNNILTAPGPPVSPLPVQGYPDRRPSLDSLPSRDDADRPPSPMSPQFPIQPTTEARGRSVVPVHHGIDHDFGPETNMERARRRSRSFSRPFNEAENRRRSEGPDLQDHPAFQRQPSAEDLAMPEGFYPNSISPREALLPRQQAPEYALEGVGPPEFPPVQNNPRSRRGSRSSAFLKSFRKSYTDPESPRLPASSSDHPDDSPADSSSNMGTRSKRSSLFHLRKSQTDLANTQSAPRSRSSTVTQLPGPAPLPASKPAAAEEDDEFPMRAKSRSSTGFSKKLQRSSTAATGKAEGEGEKKKRFSGIGSLFGRSQKRQSTVDRSSKGSKDKIGAQTQQLASSSQGHKPQRSMASTSRQEPFIDRAPFIEQPPVEGFYAPQRASSRQNGPNMTDSVQRPRNTRAPSSSTRADMPAYVQDSSFRQPSSPPIPAQSAKSTRTSIDFLRKASQSASNDLSTNRAAGSEAKDKGSAWTRFSSSTHGRSKSRHSQMEQLDRGISNKTPIMRPSNPGTAAPPQELRQHQARSDSPAPPPPPPKDEWHRARPRQSSLNAHAQLPHHTPRGPSQVSPPLPEHGQQRYFLPPLQTDVPSPSLGPIRSGLSSGDPQSGSSNRALVSPAEKRRSRQREIENAPLSAGSNAGSRPMSPEEKRRSRQIEIETGHLSPARSPVGRAKEPHSLSPGDDERVVMSATSFPGQEWQPGGGYGGY